MSDPTALPVQPALPSPATEPMHLRTLEVDEEKWQEQVSESSVPVLVHFSSDTAADANLENRLRTMEITCVACYLRLTASATSRAAEEFCLRIIPTLLLFRHGKPVAHFVGSGHELAAIASAIMNAASLGPDDIRALTREDLRNASATIARRHSAEQWQHAVMSGLIAGIAVAIAFAYLSFTPAIIISGLILQFLIRNPNLGLNSGQQFVAVALMATIALYWRELLDLFASLSRN